MQLNQTSGQMWICNTILPYLAKNAWLKKMHRNITYLKRNWENYEDSKFISSFENKFMFILIKELGCKNISYLQICLIYANMYKIKDEWNLQVTKHLLFKQIQLKEGFFQKIVSIHFHLNDDSNTKDFECNLAISLGPYFHP